MENKRWRLPMEIETGGCIEVMVQSHYRGFTLRPPRDVLGKHTHGEWDGRFLIPLLSGEVYINMEGKKWEALEE